MRVAVLTLLALVAVAGCGDERDADPPLDAVLDCAYPLDWDGITYDAGLDLPSTFEVGPILGTGVVLGCGDASTGVIPDEAAGVMSIDGIDPEVAVAVSLEGSAQPIVWLAPGYVIENPEHPLHSAAIKWLGVGERPDNDYTCGPALETRARALSTPRRNYPLQVRADDPAVESLLTEPGTGRVVRLAVDTTITGLERHGVPYVGRGDEFTLVLRACDGKESEPGVAGLRLLYADRLAGDG